MQHEEDKVNIIDPNADTSSRHFTLRKDEKLRHRSLVERLFREGNSVFEFPIRMMWRILSADELSANFRDCVPPRIGKLQMMVTVPKKKRRHAIDRVLMRRRIREAYRLNRLPIKDALAGMPEVGTLGVAFVYVHTENVDYAKIEKKMKILLSRIDREITGYVK